MRSTSRFLSYVRAPALNTCLKIYLTQMVTAGNRTDEDAVPEMITLFHNTPSVLLRHEVAYTLGQMQRIDAVPFLEALLTDHDEHPITRHEAAEALGAIEAPESVAILARHAADSASEVSETCGLALAQLNFQIAKGVCGCHAGVQTGHALVQSLAMARWIWYPSLSTHAFYMPHNDRTTALPPVSGASGGHRRRCALRRKSWSRASGGHPCLSKRPHTPTSPPPLLPWLRLPQLSASSCLTRHSLPCSVLASNPTRPI